MRKYSKDTLESIVKTSSTYWEVAKLLGVKRKSSGSYPLIIAKIKEFKIDTSHFSVDRTKSNLKIPLNNILVENSNYSSSKLKSRLIREGYKEAKCEKCGLTEWLGEEITLDLDHINRNNSDNRLENLQILCPNCHRQKTSKDKAKDRENASVRLKKDEANKQKCRLTKRKFNPDRKHLEDLIWSMPVTKVAKLFGVSDVAVHKRCKLLGVTKPPIGYWIRNK